MEHIAHIEKDIGWIKEIMRKRAENINIDFDDILPPSFSSKSVYADFITENSLSTVERLMLIMTVMPHMDKDFFCTAKYEDYILGNISGSVFGTVKSETSHAYLPTGHTLMFLACGPDNIKKSRLIDGIFSERFTLIQKRIVVPVASGSFDPILSNVLAIDSKYAVAFITNNKNYLN